MPTNTVLAMLLLLLPVVARAEPVANSAPAMRPAPRLKTAMCFTDTLRLMVGSTVRQRPRASSLGSAGTFGG